MTHPSPLSDLIARLREATGADVDLDGEIFAAVFGVETSWISPFQHLRVWGYWKEAETGGTFCHPVPKLTESIDAALTLVPEGWRVTHAYGPPWHWSLTRNEPTAFVQGKSATPAIALAIAALEARALGIGERNR